MDETSIEDECHLPSHATLTTTDDPWYLKTSGGANIVISPETLLRPQGRCLVVGRLAGTADIRVQHKSISRRHAILYYLEDKLVLQDMGGKYGTYVNGQRIQQGVVTTLRPDDSIMFGSVRETSFTVQAPPRNKKRTPTSEPESQPTLNDASMHHHSQPTKSPPPVLTGRAQREAEIAAMMASLNETPIYQKFLPEESKEVPVSHVESSIFSAAEKYSLPVTERLDLEGQGKVNTSLAVDAAGSRFAVGGTDTHLRLYDFAGMDRHRTGPFKTIEVEDGHIVVDACYSNSGDRLLVATGSVQPKVLDRDGNEIVQFVRGDMYVMDPARTSGHTAPVTGVDWHPLERDWVLTSSLDGSARLWNLKGKTQFQKLVCDKVYRAKNRKGQRVGVTSVAFHPGGRELALGTACGTIEIWNSTRVGARPERVGYYSEEKPIHSLVYNVDGSQLASRSMNEDAVHVWDAKRLSKTATPLVTCLGLPSVHERANCAFSPDGHLLCAGTSESISGETQGQGQRRVESGTLRFFSIPESASSDKNTVDSILTVDVAADAGVVMVKWHTKLNQIFVGRSDGRITIFFDRRYSIRGAILATSKAGRPIDELSQLLASRAPTGSAGITGEILVPNALPMFREEKETKRKREKERMDPVKSRRPEPPASGIKTGGQSGAAVNFTQFIAKSTFKNKNIAGKDPREELFKYSEGKDFVSQAYGGDSVILADKTVEEEEEEMKTKK